jgi:hypothetical protein
MSLRYRRNSGTKPLGRGVVPLAEEGGSEPHGDPPSPFLFDNSSVALEHRELASRVGDEHVPDVFLRRSSRDIAVPNSVG